MHETDHSAKAASSARAAIEARRDGSVFGVGVATIGGVLRRIGAEGVARRTSEAWEM